MVTNSWVINSVIHICLFQVSITVFTDISRLFHTYDHFHFRRTATELSRLPPRESGTVCHIM